MSDPVSSAISKAGLKAGQDIGRRMYAAVNGARSSVKAAEAVAELVAEQESDRDRRLLAETVAKEVAAVLVELYEGHEWSSEAEEEHPREEDVVSAAVELVREARRAGSNRKREVLFHAFYMRFKPEFYKTGMAKMLWTIACDLEYPTMRALKAIDELEEKTERKRQLSSPGTLPFGAHVTYDAEEWPHVGRLEAHGLLVRDRGGSKNATVFVSTLGRAFMRFALEEYWEHGGLPAAEG